jgi:hypothetical protein
MEVRMGISRPEERTGSMDQGESEKGGEKFESRPVMERTAATVGKVVGKVEKEVVDDGVVIAGDADEIAQETADVSPEGRPGDPKTGPAGLRLEVLLGFFVVVCIAVALGLFMNVLAGVLALVIGTLAILFNPVVGATTQRANEREAVAEHHKTDDPNTVVVRTTSKRQERRESRTM